MDCQDLVVSLINSNFEIKSLFKKKKLLDGMVAVVGELGEQDVDDTLL